MDFSQFHVGRRQRHARPVRPHEGDCGKYRQRQFHLAPRPAAIPIAARSPPRTPASTASWAPAWCSPGKPIEDQSEFRTQYDPGNPNADKQGYIKLPNVDPLIEIMDMKEAQRSYEADLTVMDATKQMQSRTVDLLNK